MNFFYLFLQRLHFYFSVSPLNGKHNIKNEENILRLLCMQRRENTNKTRFMAEEKTKKRFEDNKVIAQTNSINNLLTN